MAYEGLEVQLHAFRLAIDGDGQLHAQAKFIPAERVYGTQ